MIIDLKNCTVRLVGGSSGNFINVKIGTGTLQYTEKKNIDYILDRGKIDTVREGDESPIDVRLDAQWDHILGASPDTTPTVSDALKNAGLASGWTSSADNPCEPYAVDLVIYDVTPCADYDETITLADFRYESLQYDLKTGMISITGKSNAKKATATRTSSISLPTA